MFKLFIFVIILFLLFLGIVLGVLNPSLVELDLFILKAMFPLGVILAVSLVIGALLGSAVSSLQIGRLKWQLRKQQRENQKRLNQIVQLKKNLSNDSKALSHIKK